MRTARSTLLFLLATTIFLAEARSFSRGERQARPASGGWTVRLAVTLHRAAILRPLRAILWRLPALPAAMSSPIETSPAADRVVHLLPMPPPLA
jgi:hypothetical protein